MVWVWVCSARVSLLAHITTSPHRTFKSSQDMSSYHKESQASLKFSWVIWSLHRTPSKTLMICILFKPMYVLFIIFSRNLSWIVALRRATLHLDQVYWDETQALLYLTSSTLNLVVKDTPENFIQANSRKIILSICKISAGSLAAAAVVSPNLCGTTSLLRKFTYILRPNQIHLHILCHYWWDRWYCVHQLICQALLSEAL